MNKKKVVSILCLFIGSIIWAVSSWINFSEGNIVFSIIQIILSICFIVKAIIIYTKNKDNKHWLIKANNLKSYSLLFSYIRYKLYSQHILYLIFTFDII